MEQDFWNDPAFKEILRKHIEKSLLDAESSLLARIQRDVLNSSPIIKLPRFSKDPLDAEIVLDDILDAEVVGEE